MRGAAWSYESDPDVIHKMASLLAGMALLFAKDKDDIRKGDAFRGRISLPFLACLPPPAHCTRMAWVSGTSEWVVYTTDEWGRPRVKCRASGYGGFCECILLLASKFTR